MTSIRLYLATLHPLAWHALVAAVAWLACYLVRRYRPALWERIPSRLQALPALLVGAVLGASTGAEATEAMLAAMRGALDGLLAIGAHHALKELPGPYLGGSWPAAGQAKEPKA